MRCGCPCSSTITDQDLMWDFRRSIHFSRFVEVVKHIIEDGKNLEVFSVLIWTFLHRRNLLGTNNLKLSH